MQLQLPCGVISATERTGPEVRAEASLEKSNSHMHLKDPFIEDPFRNAGGPPVGICHNMINDISTPHPYARLTTKHDTRLYAIFSA